MLIFNANIVLMRVLGHIKCFSFVVYPYSKAHFLYESKDYVLLYCISNIVIYTK